MSEPQLYIPLHGLSDKERLEAEVEVNEDIELTARDLRYLFAPSRVDDFLWLEGASAAKTYESVELTPSQFVSSVFRLPERKNNQYAPFSFEGRRHMYQPYDTACRKVLLCTARQCEKCVTLDTLILMADGSKKPAGDVRVGDRVFSMDVAGGSTELVIGTVSWVSAHRKKPCLRIETRRGRMVDVATTHPMRVQDGWKESGHVRVGEPLGVATTALTVAWDEVVRIQEVGEQTCVDFEVDDQHNFVAGGFITHNSTLLGNRILTYACLIPGYTVLFVSPSAAQTKTFSSDRLKVPISLSTVLGAYTSPALSMNVFEKQFINSSRVTLRYAYLTADRTRGISAKMLSIDEIQHVLSKNIPIIEECISHAPEDQRMQIYSGTPLSYDNVIESYRSNLSTQSEWVIPCDAHGGETGRYWNILGVKNIQKQGLSCAKCGKLINAQHPDAQWAAQVAWDPDHTPFESYRISQLMAPWKEWADILQSFKNYSQAQFHNEVLGLSYDGGMRPLTAAQVKACCSANVSMHPKYMNAYARHSLVHPVWMGIDWGGGGTESSSYDVITLMTYVDQRMRVFYARRLMGEEAEPQNRLMIAAELIRKFNVRRVGVDYGGGYDPNDYLIRTFGPERIWKFHYMAKLNGKIVPNAKLGRIMLHRSEVMSALFSAIQRKKFEFPRWEEWQAPFGADLINIHAEYNDKMRMLQYDTRPGLADDTFHSILFGFLASQGEVARPDILAPRREDPRQVVGFGVPVYEDLNQG